MMEPLAKRSSTDYLTSSKKQCASTENTLLSNNAQTISLENRFLTSLSLKNNLLASKIPTSLTSVENKLPTTSLTSVENKLPTTSLTSSKNKLLTDLHSSKYNLLPLSKLEIDSKISNDDETSNAYPSVEKICFSNVDYPQFQRVEYKLEHLYVEGIQLHQLVFSNIDLIKPKLSDVPSMKYSFVMAVAASLVKAPNFKDKNDFTLQSLCNMAIKLAEIDPEFVLKVALYARAHLYIRTTSNFLLAFSANNISCRPYLKKYFNLTVKLPSDWLSVVELYQCFIKDGAKNRLALPAVLRGCLVEKFPEFDLYQLGKYNKGKTKKTRLRKKAKQMAATVFSDQVSKHKSKSLTLKYLIRRLHVTKPVDHVMRLLEKRYPEDLQSFYKSRLPGTWDPDQSGKKMKLPVPETWETALSLRGNKAAVWEELIDNKKLPFMAMLRNLSNLLGAGISEKHHKWVLNKLTNEDSVIQSKQLPIRFLSASNVIDSLKNLRKAKATIIKSHLKKDPPKWWELRNKRLKLKKAKRYNEDLLMEYSNALNEAMKIAANHNLTPIKGNSIILCQMNQKPNADTSAIKQSKLLVPMFGLMCSWACENCLLYAFDPNKVNPVTLPESFDIYSIICIEAGYLYCPDSLSLKDFLEDLIKKRTQFNNLIVLSDRQDEDIQETLQQFLSPYRHIVNSDLLYIFLSVEGNTPNIPSVSHSKDIYISGQSDQLLRFIAEHGNHDQLEFIENIDTVYQLKPLPHLLKKAVKSKPKQLQPLKQPSLIPVWRTVRVFISSTFKDMHGERDLLVRYVFPELRERAKKHFINIYEVDLRWGITEEEALSNRTLEVCLSEIDKCQLFVGLLGERYGTILDNYSIPDKPEFDWLKEYPPDASVTELEIYYAALSKPNEAKGKAFFYFRDNKFENNIPDEWRNDFISESPTAHAKISQLKNNIKKTGLEVFDGYPCQWGGAILGAPVVAGLDVFGQRVLNNLWTAILNLYPENDLLMDCVSHESSNQESYLESCRDNFVGRKVLVKKIMDSLKENEKPSLLLLYGKPGSGKTVLMAHLAEACLKNAVVSNRDSIITHFIGITPTSTNIDALLRRICSELQKRFSLDDEIPENYQELCESFSEILTNATEVSKSPIFIIIDGLDLLENSFYPQNLSWLPEKIPKGVTFIISTLESGSFHRILTTRKLTTIQVGSLETLDRAEVIRAILAKHRKSLDESPFNNQLKLLLLKREAHNPLFLQLACEELRLHRVFEGLTDKLKSLGNTVDNLILQIMDRLETNHGKHLISTALCLLACTRNGLKDTCLHYILSLKQYIGTKFNVCDILEANLPPDQYIAASTFLQMLHGIRILLKSQGQTSEDLLQLAHHEIKEAIQTRYLKKLNQQEKYQLHRLIAGYFWLQADPSKDGTWQGKHIQAFTELSYHLVNGHCLEDFQKILCSISFIQAKCSLGLGNQFLEDFNLTQGESVSFDNEWKEFENLASIMEYKSFVLRNNHTLNQYPCLTLQLAVNDPDKFQPSKDARKQLSKSSFQSMFEWLNKPQEISSCTRTINNLAEVVSALAVSSDSQALMACGFKNGIIRLYNLSNGKEIQTFTGHANNITSVCFVSKTKLCSASSDSNLSIWDINNGHRLFILDEHSRQVNSCCSDPAGQVVVSVGWDFYLKAWDVSNGRCICSIRPEMRPINCVSMCSDHPEVVVIGTWSGKLRIWDLYRQEEMKVIIAHKAAVRDVIYSSSGKYIASVCLEGVIKLWDVNSGTTISLMVGHTLPVNRMTFSAKDESLITVSDDNTAKIWSSTPGKCVTCLESSDHSVPLCVAVSTNGQFVAVGYDNYMLRAFNKDSGSEVFSTVVHRGAINCVKYNEENNFIITGSSDAKGKIFSNKGDCLGTLDGHTKPILSLECAFKYVCTTSEDRTVFLYKIDYKKWNASNPRVLKPLARLTGHTAPVTCCAFSSRLNYLFTGSQDKSLFVWPLEPDKIMNNPKPVKIIKDCHADWITCCDRLDNATTIVTGSNDHMLKVRNWKTDEEVCWLTGHQSAITCVQCVPGFIISGDLEGTIKVWSKEGIELTTLKGHKNRINCISIIKPDYEWKYITPTVYDNEVYNKQSEDGVVEDLKQDGIIIVSCSDDKSVRFWRPFWSEELTTLCGHSEAILTVATSQDGQIVTSSLDKTVKLWQYSKPENSNDNKHSDMVTCIAVSANGSDCITGSRDGSIIVWRMSANDKQWKIITNIKIHSLALTALVFVDEMGMQFASASEDRTIVLWQINRLSIPHQSCHTWTSKCSPYSTLDCSSNWKYLASGSWNGDIYIFDLKTYEELFYMSFHNYWVCNVKFLVTDSYKLVVTSANKQVMILHLEREQEGEHLEVIKSNEIDMDVLIREAVNEKQVYPSGIIVPNLYEDWTESLALDVQSHYYVALTQGFILKFENGFVKPLIQKIHHSRVSACQVTSDGMIVFTASYDHTIKVWRVSSSNGLQQIGLFTCPGKIICLGLSRDNLLIAGDIMGNVLFLKWL